MGVAAVELSCLTPRDVSCVYSSAILCLLFGDLRIALAPDRLTTWGEVLVVSANAAEDRHVSGFACYLPGELNLVRACVQLLDVAMLELALYKPCKYVPQSKYSGGVHLPPVRCSCPVVHDVGCTVPNAAASGVWASS